MTSAPAKLEEKRRSPSTPAARPGAGRASTKPDGPGAKPSGLSTKPDGPGAKPSGPSKKPATPASAGRAQNPPTPPLDETRRQAILRAAFAVFAREGFHKASIKLIAAEAGLKSPALIYWYFRDKNELFEKVLVECSPMLSAVPDLTRLMDEPPHVVLPMVAQAYLSLCEVPDGERMFRLVVAEMAHHQEMGDRLAQQGFSLFKDFLTTYLRRQVKLGRLKPHDCEAGAASLAGPLFVYVFTRAVTPALAQNLPASAAFAKHVVRVFLEGLGQNAPSPAVHPNTAKSSAARPPGKPAKGKKP